MAAGESDTPGDTHWDIRVAPTRGLDPETLYGVLRLRVDVFVVEQECAYAELDGRDLEPGALLVWAADGDTVAATLRVLIDPDGRARIGRVATSARHRGSGLAAALMRAAITEAGGRAIVLDAQAHLQAWYERFGFVAVGELYVEDGIPHVPMCREGG